MTDTPRTADEQAVLSLTADELTKIADTLRNLKGNGYSLPITSITLVHPQKSSTVQAERPATRGEKPILLATFVNAGGGGGQLARTLKLAVEYLDLLPVAVRMLRAREAVLTDIANYTLPTFKIQRGDATVEIVDFEFADTLRTMAEEALGQRTDHPSADAEILSSESGTPPNGAGETKSSSEV